MIDLFSTIDQFFTIPDFHRVYPNLWAVAVLADDVSHGSVSDDVLLNLSEATSLVKVREKKSIPMFSIVILLSLKTLFRRLCY